MSTMIQVTEPTMVLNEEVCKSNIARMAAKAKAANVVFRPHFKTHQSREIGEWFRASGVDKITVSSLNMAMKFAEWGWNDITCLLYISPSPRDSTSSRMPSSA